MPGANKLGSNRTTSFNKSLIASVKRMIMTVSFSPDTGIRGPLE
jgi:hypothetical protein